jgi:hypothetical protein
MTYTGTFVNNPGVLGVNANLIETVADLAKKAAAGNNNPLFALGTTTGGEKLRAVWAKATEAITASTTTCAINNTTFAATATLGTFKSPPVNMANGDYGWFTQASAA